MLDQIIADSGQYRRSELRLRGDEGLPLSIQEFNRLVSLPEDQLTPEQSRALWRECARKNVVYMVEAYEQIAKIVGRELFVDRLYITGVHKKRGVIYEYRIQKNGHDIWLSKSEIISMAASHQLHAIVVHMKNGACYLRPEYHAKPFFSLIA